MISGAKIGRSSFTDRQTTSGYVRVTWKEDVETARRFFGHKSVIDNALDYVFGLTDQVLIGRGDHRNRAYKNCLAKFYRSHG